MRFKTVKLGNKKKMEYDLMIKDGEGKIVAMVILPSSVPKCAAKELKLVIESGIKSLSESN